MAPASYPMLKRSWPLSSMQIIHHGRHSLGCNIHLEILNELNETMSLDMTELHGRVVRNALYK